MTDSPAEVFAKRQSDFQADEQADQRRYDQWAIGRVAWFGVIVGVGWSFFRVGADTAAYLTMSVGAAGFLWLMNEHQLIRRSRDLHHHLVSVNEDEAARLDRRYLRPETGVAFTDPAHPYAADLDLFGPHSLFRLLNRTHTHDGQQRLAHWLGQPAPADMIFFRQQAIADLRVQLDWRQQFEATARLNERVGASPADLRQWASATEPAPPGYLHWLRWLLPAITLLTGLVWLAGLVSGWVVLWWLALHAAVLAQTGRRVKAVSDQTHTLTRALSGFEALLRLAEATPGQATRLCDVRLALQYKTADGKAVGASVAVGRLARLTENLNFRRNPYFYLFVGIALLWDVHYLIALDRWRRQYGPALGGWFDALAELEALNSLAGFAFAHPDYATPDITDDALLLQAETVRHPLLPPSRSIANSLIVSKSGQTVLITGSNMSGKSTFLRTLGLNVVLALAGSVVAARRFACSPVQVFTSMRTQDSLEENTSSFYAELKRLQTLLQLTDAIDPSAKESTEGQADTTSLSISYTNGQSLPRNRLRQDRLPVLFFLDEILKGTNSADRHRGAEALIRQLHRTSASGFVSTHDLSLGQLSEAAGFVRNFHFQSDVIDGRLIFDYTLRDGVCRSFNASELMRQIGIDIDGLEAVKAAPELSELD